MLIAQRRHHTSTFIEKKRFLSEFDVPQCNRGKNTCVTTFRENQFSLCWDTLVFWRKKEDFLYIFSLTVTDISKWGKNLKKNKQKTHHVNERRLHVEAWEVWILMFAGGRAERDWFNKSVWFSTRKKWKVLERLNILSFMGKNYFQTVHQRLFQNLKEYFSAYNFTS